MTGSLTECLNLILSPETVEPWTITALMAIFKTNNDLDVYVHFLRNGWSTTREVRDALDMPEATAYRVVKDLREAGVIQGTKLNRAPKNNRSPVKSKGPRETVWRLNDEL